MLVLYAFWGFGFQHIKAIITADEVIILYMFCTVSFALAFCPHSFILITLALN